ncbi:MAG: coproporphyrinogen dehydrogenase HemZ, partial [Lachnospiraceae bacterium]|nr:coproporphyrinogen dehydrogenase HemZ [Lachnospiraceae bacterium]
TPTTLDADKIDRLLTAIETRFDMGTVIEFTVEAGRADSITKEKLEVLKKHKVTRISINPQTMKQETLDIIGRRASVEQVLEAYKLARSLGFDNINMDTILGLPGEDENDVKNTMDTIRELNPDSLTVHSLAIKRASALSKWIEEHGRNEFINTDETMRYSFETAEKMGLVPYYLYRQKNMAGNFENVGFAGEGKLGIYNILIMEEVQTIVACGAGTITKRVYEDGLIKRCENVKEVPMYCEKIEEMLDRKRELFS